MRRFYSIAGAAAVLVAGACNDLEIQNPNNPDVERALASAEDVKNISVSTLTIGAQYDTMDPKHMEWMSKQLPKGHYLYCPNGSHLAIYDDQKTYMDGVIGFLKDVDAGKF